MRPSLPRFPRLYAALALSFVAHFGAANAATLIVNSNADTVANNGACTLREAIIAANTNAPSGMAMGECPAGSIEGQDQIIFAIPGNGPHTITPGSALPNIGSSLSIDGYSQPGASANTLVGLTEGFNAVLAIVIDGGPPSNVSRPGLNILGPSGSNTRIRGLKIQNFTSSGCCTDTGIVVSGATANVEILGNEIANNGSRGVFTITSGGLHTILRIGGPNAADRNLIYGHQFDSGIVLNDCENCVVENNWIGLRILGGAAVAAANTYGVYPNSSPGSTVRNNWIAGNTSAGVLLIGFNEGVAVTGNLIGGGFANGLGIEVGNIGNFGPTDSTITGNRITGNTTVGVGIRNSQAGNGLVRNFVRGNQIYANGGIAIDLGANGGPLNGVTLNDIGDSDLGPNALQNYPVFEEPTYENNTIRIPYSIDSADTLYDLDFSFSTMCHASGNGPAGKMRSNAVTLSGRPPSGVARVPMNNVPRSGFVSATATGVDGTSEFSACLPYVFSDVIFTDGLE